MRMKKLITLMSLPVFLSCFSSAQQVIPVDMQEKYPIHGWGGTHSMPVVEDTLYRDMAEAGFTHMVFDSEDHLDLAARYGIKIYLSAPELRQNFRQFDMEKARKDFAVLHKRVGGHPALAGYAISDEPVTALFNGLAGIIKIINEADPIHPSYVNLFPVYVSLDLVDAPNYRSYVEDFITVCKPHCFGYDNYSFMEGEEDVHPRYWENLELFHELSVKHNIPFRFILLGVGHLHYSVPDEAIIRYQVFTALAAGAKALEYFTYVTPDCGNFRKAPLDINGEKTETWHIAKRVNNTVQIWAPVLNHLQTKAIYHFPSTTDLPEERKIKALPNGNFFAGEFIHKETGENWIIIVNKDLKKSANCAPEWMNAPAEVLRHSNTKKGILMQYTGEQCYLAPGDAVLLRIK